MLCVFQEHPTGGSYNKDCHCKYQIVDNALFIVDEHLASQLVYKHCSTQTSHANQTIKSKTNPPRAKTGTRNDCGSNVLNTQLGYFHHRVFLIGHHISYQPIRQVDFHYKVEI